MTKKRLAAQVYISKNKDLYNHFLEQKVAIEEFLGEEISWHEASIDVMFGYDTYNADLILIIGINTLSGIVKRL